MQISFRFGNLSSGETILIDDLSAIYTACPIAPQNPFHSLPNPVFPPSPNLQSIFPSVPVKTIVPISQSANTFLSSNFARSNSLNPTINDPSELFAPLSDASRVFTPTGGSAAPLPMSPQAPLSILMAPHSSSLSLPMSPRSSPLSLSIAPSSPHQNHGAPSPVPLRVSPSLMRRTSVDHVTGCRGGRLLFLVSVMTYAPIKES